MSVKIFCQYCTSRSPKFLSKSSLEVQPTTLATISSSDFELLMTLTYELGVQRSVKRWIIKLNQRISLDNNVPDTNTHRKTDRQTDTTYRLLYAATKVVGEINHEPMHVIQVSAVADGPVRRASCCAQGSMISVINWRQSLVELSCMATIDVRGKFFL